MHSFESNRNGNGFGSRSVLFAPDVSNSSSSYSISEQLKVNQNHIGNPSATPTSQLIKQTLSPLTHHRNIQSACNPLDTNGLTSLKNQTNNGSTLGTYQFPSSSLTLNSSKTNQSTLVNENSSSIHKSSPSRTLSNHTNTLPSSIARNMLYQSESSYSLKNQPNSFASPGNSITSASVVPQTNNIYGTLPKTSSPFSGNSTANVYGNVSAVANEFEQLIARNATGTGQLNTTGAGNYNTLGSYRVQYSSTNPFLPSFNPHSAESNSTNTDKIHEEK